MSTSTEEDDRNRNETFSLMKQWLLAKLQVSQTNIPESCSGGRQQLNRDRDLHPSGLPKIIISGGSDKSIDHIHSPSPQLKRPRPLVRSWTNYVASPKEARETPASVPHNCTNTFWNSPFIVKKEFGDAHCNSLPGSPSERKPDTIVRETNNKLYKEKSFDAKSTNKINIPMYDMLNQVPSTPSCSRSVLDCPSMCGFCGQKKFSGSRELIGFEDFNSTSCDVSRVHSAVNSPRLKQRHIGLRRTSSCHIRQNSDKKRFNKTERMTKATSNIDFQKRSVTKSRKTKSFRSSARSTISLTRSWSINLETFRIVKSGSLKTNSDDRKMSLNDSELRRVSERRRSSLIRLLCVDNTDSDKEDQETISLEGTESISDIPAYSPKVTRTPIFVYGDQLDDFKSTFDPEAVRAPSDFGQLKVMFQFYNDRKELTISLLKGANVAPNINGTLGLYAKMCLMPGKKQSQTGSDKHDTRDPVFYETFTFRMTLGELLDRELRIKLYNKPGTFSSSEPIAECYISLYHYDLTAVTVIWQNLQACRTRMNGEGSQQQRRGGLRYLLCGI